MSARPRVLDQRTHVDWKIVPCRDTINDPNVAERHGLYHAILRTGMIQLESIPEDEPDRDNRIKWIPRGQFTPESLRRLRDAIDQALADAGGAR